MWGKVSLNRSIKKKEAQKIWIFNTDHQMSHWASLKWLREPKDIVDDLEKLRWETHMREIHGAVLVGNKKAKKMIITCMT